MVWTACRPTAIDLSPNSELTWGARPPRALFSAPSRKTSSALLQRNLRKMVFERRRPLSQWPVVQSDRAAPIADSEY